MREKGELVKKGSITEQGDVEFWTDESEKHPPKTPDESHERLRAQVMESKRRRG